MYQSGATQKLIYKIISNQSVLNLDLSNFGQAVISVNLEHFYYDAGNNNVKVMGIRIEGLRGHLNEFNNESDVLENIPCKSGVFEFVTQDSVTSYCGGCKIPVQFMVSFVSRDNGSGAQSWNMPLLNFSSNYVFHLSVEVALDY